MEVLSRGGWFIKNTCSIGGWSVERSFREGLEERGGQIPPINQAQEVIALYLCFPTLSPRPSKGSYLVDLHTGNSTPLFLSSVLKPINRPCLVDPHTGKSIPLFLSSVLKSDQQAMFGGYPHGQVHTRVPQLCPQGPSTGHVWWISTQAALYYCPQPCPQGIQAGHVLLSSTQAALSLSLPPAPQGLPIGGISSQKIRCSNYCFDR